MKTIIALITVCLFAALFFAGVAAQALAVPTAGGLACALFAGVLCLITVLCSVFITVIAWIEWRKPC